MKLASIISCVILCLTLTGCQNPSNLSTENSLSDASEILSIVFDSIMGSKEYWKQMELPVQPPLDTQSTNYLSEKRYQQFELDSIQHKLDTALFYVYIDKSVKTLNYHLESIKTISSENNFQEKFLGADASYRNLLVELTKNLSFQSLNIHDIKSKYHYVVQSLNAKQKNHEHLVILGNVSFSRIIYNLENDRACIYAQIQCGGICGEGNIYFLEKISKKWKIVFTRNLWVS